jgi:probable F420-dependent oxidoreductase
MQTGVTTLSIEGAIRPDDLARDVEARGIGAVLFGEHTHIPAHRRPGPDGSTPPVPDMLCHTLDPFVACAVAAAVTTTTLVGTAVSVVAEHDPIVLAKEIASIDQLSDGRFVFGAGYSSIADELVNHGLDPDRRRAIAREKILALRSLWTTDIASYEGEHVRFDGVISWPKPLQQPSPPVLIGGDGPTALRHVAEFADGWLPTSSVDFRASLPLLEAACENAGRDPATVQLVAVTRDLTPAALDDLTDLGVDRVLVFLPPTARDATRTRLDEIAAAFAHLDG